MSEMNLFNYYSLDECIDRKVVINKLKSLKNEGKIEYSIEHEILKIDDIDLEESDLEELTELFDENDIFPYLDYEDDGDEDDDYDGYDQDDEY